MVAAFPDGDGRFIDHAVLYCATLRMLGEIQGMVAQARERVEHSRTIIAAQGQAFQVAVNSAGANGIRNGAAQSASTDLRKTPAENTAGAR